MSLGGQWEHLAPALLHGLNSVGALCGGAMYLPLKGRPQQRLLRAQLQHLL